MNNLENISTEVLNNNTHFLASIINGGLIGFALIIFLLLIIWSLVWKGIALWKSARNGSKAWFIIFLIINTLGILEIIYIFLISKRHPKKETNQQELNQNN